MRTPRALVIGAGIGGLTAAVALERRGWDVTVLERATTLEPVGAGISVSPNAQRALDVIGLGDAVRELRAWDEVGGLRTPSGRWLVRTSNDVAAERFGGPLVLLHRATLVELLRGALTDPSRVRTGSTARLTDPGGTDTPAVVRERTSGGEERRHEAELVVAADGIHSTVRAALFPTYPGPRYAGFTTWRTVVDAIDGTGDGTGDEGGTGGAGGAGGHFAAHETWGRGCFWGTQPLPDGRVYAYAAATLPAGLRAADDELAELRRRFGRWHDPIPQVLAATTPERVLRNDVYEMAEPLPAYHRGRAAVLGDAAHAMSPRLGQGGNQAIEDAIVLAHHADPAAGLDGALAAYTRDRLPRATAVGRRAASMTRATTLTSAPACALRDWGFAALSRLVPKVSSLLALRALDGVADWSPPVPTYASDFRGTR
ncbi:FAD-dependent oxidoreductase [Streptomyces sp. NPDC048172]|uniref:FAD-dependent oxidoreductase n=1 Tax=Streptomyces sp. NPDC048172 TaxID=3365505 RepID=UPI0037187356